MKTVLRGLCGLPGLSDHAFQQRDFAGGQVEQAVDDAVDPGFGSGNFRRKAISARSRVIRSSQAERSAIRRS
ncbi:MAG: hypothetical protein IOD01_08685 [Rhodobacter sp.]|nr:hypothetical protein [Rhodobacter sp.]